MLERRHSIRQKSLYRGIVYFDDSPVASECTVRDMSETGARLRFSTPVISSITTLQLEVPLKCLKFQCAIVWRADGEVGVSFIGATISNEKQDTPPIEQRVSKLEDDIAELKLLVNRLLKFETAASDT